MVGFVLAHIDVVHLLRYRAATVTTGATTQPSKARSLFWVALCYLLCFSTAWAWLQVGPKTTSVLLDAFVADLLAALVIFVFSRIFRNSSFFDSAWSVVPPFFFAYWWLSRSPDADVSRLALMAVVVAFWAVRLTLNWAVHWEGLHEEDWRYPMLREKAPKLELVTDLLLIHIFPIAEVFLGILPVYAAACLSTQPVGPLDIFAFALGLAAVTLEMVADLQLHRFIKDRKPGQLLDQGLWAYSRHPNYFGEFLFWLSLALFGVSAVPSQWWWQVAGALSILIMFVAGSIPMMEKKLAQRPGYQALIARVSMFVLWPPKADPTRANESSSLD